MNKIIIPIFAFLCVIPDNISSVSTYTLKGLDVISDGKLRNEVSALLEVYGKHFQVMEERDGDLVFRINGSWIYYRDGKMLSEDHCRDEDRYDSIFYPYPIGKLTRIPPYRELPRRAPDFLNLLFGQTERKIRNQCQLISFLNHKAFVNRICVEALKQVEKEIMHLTETVTAVRDYVDHLHILYSFQSKQVVGSENNSYHSYGLAIDLVPLSYHGKHVYWKWSRVFNKKWYDIPLESRWSPPQEVIDAFENNGFIWGGKWCHFDVIHFEYRPEIIRLAKTEDDK